MILRTSGLTYHTCTTPAFAHTHVHICTCMCTHTHTPACQCTHLFTHICTQARNRFSGTHLCAHTQVCTGCMWVSILYSGVCAQLYFPGWGSEASPGTSGSTAFSKSPTWWTLGVSANPSSKPECPWDQSTTLGSTQAGWQ